MSMAMTGFCCADTGGLNVIAAASNSVIETIGIRPYRVGREARSDGGLRVVEKAASITLA